MRRRHLYVVMFAAPAMLAAAIASILLLAVLVAVLWAFVLGDNTWPTAAYAMLIIAAAVSFLGICAILLSLAYSAGLSQEARAELNLAHVALSTGTTALLVLLAVAICRYFYSS